MTTLPGDTIKVCEGVYPEGPGPLRVNKTLTFLGARSGTDARTRSGPESIITDPQGTYVTANSVVFDGFTIQDSTVGAFTGYGIDLAAATSGAQVLNNIIKNNIVGIGLANSGPSQLLIKHNLFQTNNQMGPASGAGIYTDEFVSGGAVTNVLITENAFTGNNDAGIDFSNTAPSASGISGLDISTNSFDGNGRAVFLMNTHMSTVQKNTIKNNTSAASAAIRLYNNNTDLTVTLNDLKNGAGHAIRLSANPDQSSNVKINKNNIGTVGSASFGGDGLLVDLNSHVGTVNAECNWWGSSSGPTNVSNPGGNGEEVVGDANFTPWWTTPSQTRPCPPPPPKCKPGERDDGEGDVDENDNNGHHHGHFKFDECDSNQEVSHQDSDRNVDFHSDSATASTPSFDAALPVATTTGQGWNNGAPVTYTLVVTDLGLGVGTDLYSLTLSDASGVIYTIAGTLTGGNINVTH